LIVPSFRANPIDLAQRVLNERRMLELASSVPHANLVGFEGEFLTTEAACLCIEAVGGGELFSLLQTHGPFAPEHARIYIGEVCLALGHLHALDIIKRDVTSENILIALDSHLKLADFASAKKMLGRIGTLPPPRAERTLVGSPPSIAPEVLTGQPACEDADVWSLGVLSAEILSGRNPFEPDDGSVETLVRNIVVEPFTPPTHAHIGPAEAAFLSALLTRELGERLGSRANGGHTAVFAHPWFVHHTAYSLLTKQAPAPWLPHLNGPAPAAPPPPPSAELIAMAARHAQGTPAPQPDAGTWTAEWAAAGFEATFGGQLALTDVASSAVPAGNDD
jgi:serine/threonine protein kinase